jgi:hypothetical protein
VKILPLGPFEAADADALHVEREGSRRFAKKEMYRAVIAFPEDEHNFDGKIYFTRVARTRVLRRNNHNDKLIDELSANAAIHKKWHELVNLTMSPSDMKDVLNEVSCLTELTYNRLVIRFKGQKGVEKPQSGRNFKGSKVPPFPRVHKQHDDRSKSKILSCGLNIRKGTRFR